MFEKIVYNFVKSKLKQEIIDDLKAQLVTEITLSIQNEIIDEIKLNKRFVVNLENHLKGKNNFKVKDMDTWQIIRTQNIVSYEIDVTYMFQDNNEGNFNFKCDNISEFNKFVKNPLNSLHPSIVDSKIVSISAVNFIVWYKPIKGVSRKKLVTEYFLGVMNDSLYDLDSYNKTMKKIEMFFDEEPQLFL
ncbi:MAG: hypothetical protein KAI79_17550 [Bacteroidales bacterium]|nr:hypothetical protein [Bacteroidales bacterium]